MQFEVNLNACRASACEMGKLEKGIMIEYEKLFKVYTFFASSDNTSERELAKRIRKELAAIENEIQKIKVFRKSLEKINDVYTNNEKAISNESEIINSRFIIPIKPISPEPIRIIRFIIPNLTLLLNPNDKSGG